MKKYLVSNKLVPINNKLVLGGALAFGTRTKQVHSGQNQPKPNFGKPLKFLV